MNFIALSPSNAVFLISSEKLRSPHMVSGLQFYTIHDESTFFILKSFNLILKSNFCRRVLIINSNYMKLEVLNSLAKALQ